MRLTLTILLCTLFASCYTARKAKQQFAKATVAYPQLAAEYCGTTYPIKEWVIQGKDSTRIDTLWADGDTHFDTVYSFMKDTVYITKFTPGKTIRETFYRVDTVYAENIAAIHALQLQLGDALEISVANAKEANKWEKRAKERLLWFIIACGLMGLGVVLRLKKVI